MTYFYEAVPQHLRSNWYGFRVLAVDGSDLVLPDYPALMDTFGVQNNDSDVSLPMAKLSFLYDTYMDMHYVLMTSLTDTKRYPTKYFYDLYHLLWRVEEGYKVGSVWVSVTFSTSWLLRQKNRGVGRLRKWCCKPMMPTAIAQNGLVKPL